MNTDEQLVEELKRDMQTLKAENTKSKIESIDASLNPELLRLTQQARDKSASSWLNAMPPKDQGLTLISKYLGLPAIAVQFTTTRPTVYLCLWRAIQRKPRSVVQKGGGGLVAQRHDGVRNLLTSLLSKVCKNVQVESHDHLGPVDNEVMKLRSATTSSDAILDVKAGGFWSRGVTVFFFMLE